MRVSPGRHPHHKAWHAALVDHASRSSHPPCRGAHSESGALHPGHRRAGDVHRGVGNEYLWRAGGFDRRCCTPEQGVASRPAILQKSSAKMTAGQKRSAPLAVGDPGSGGARDEMDALRTAHDHRPGKKKRANQKVQTPKGIGRNSKPLC